MWGQNSEDFDPDHFTPERSARIPPFGTGQRACIGRQFAMQEAILVLSMLLQRFEFVDFANYKLETKQTLTVKPDNFHIKVKLRPGRAAIPRVMTDFNRATLAVRRVKSGTPATHPIRGDELRALHQLQREQDPRSPFVFISERGSRSLQRALPSL